MANVKLGTRFDKLIFEGNLVGQLPLSFVKGTWVNKLSKQMGMMRHRVNRMDFKCFGAILQMQDRMAAEWYAKTGTPVANEETMKEVAVVDERTPPADLVPPPLPKRK